MTLQASFERLVAEHQSSVLRVCRSILRDDHLGADAAQETFLRLWNQLAEGREPNRLGAWLRRVATTTAIDFGRRRTSRRAAEEMASRERPAVETVPETELATRELDERFERAVEALPDGQRTVFLLRHRGGMPLSEVAETLGLALPTVKTQFARACLKLQSALRPFEPTDDQET